MIGKWMGWKVIVYYTDISNTIVVRMEANLDIDNNIGNWSKVTELVDSEGWYALVLLMLNKIVHFVESQVTT